MKQTLYINVVFSLLLFMQIEMLCAEMCINITQGVDSARPIGITKFQWIGSGATPEDISSIIAADLRNSGKFNPLDYSDLSQKIANVHEIQAASWNKLGVSNIITGMIRLNADDTYNVSYQLIDTTTSPTNTILTKNSYKITRQWLRYAAHSVSDEVFEKLTGIKGAFCTRIAYVAQTSDNQFPYELRISDYDGYNQFVVHRSSQPLMSPAWSSRGDKLAYVTFEHGNSALVIQTLADGIIHKVASFPRHNGAPSFSPDGTKLALALSRTGNLHIYTIDIISGQIRQITNNHSNNTEPTWFPDSQNLAYTSDQTGWPQIFKININSGFSQRITWEGLKNQGANISNDGTFMVMVAILDYGQQQHIAKQDLIGTADNIQILSSTLLDETPSLAPNGTMVIYSSSQGVGTVLNLISTNGRSKANLPITDSQVRFPAWSPYLQ